MCGVFEKVRLIWPGFFLFCLIVSCGRVNETQFTGLTMGTTYTIKVAGVVLNNSAYEQLQTQIDSVLQEVNYALSTYIPDSEISQFNAEKNTAPVIISPTMARILKKALEIHALSNGAFDITVHPLVQLWGFGNMGPRWEPPHETEIEACLQRIGSQHLRLEDRSLTKALPNLELDLSAIAKGYGVDEVARLLTQLGYDQYMVEIGGEVVCAGHNAAEVPWSIGIQYPEFTYSFAVRLIGSVGLVDRALATSGNYRNFFEFENQLYSHMINPATGYPVPNLLVSASVIAKDCMTADALATAIMILGSAAGVQMVEKLSEVECYLVEMDENGEVSTIASSGLNIFLQ